jgi:hypothetical protein
LLPSFGQMIVDIRNSTLERPDTLVLAYTRASNWCKLSANRGGTSLVQQVFLAQDERSTYKKTAGADYKSKHESSSSNKKPAAKPSNKNKKAGGGSGVSSGPSAEKPCRKCGAHDHWAPDCPGKIEKANVATAELAAGGGGYSKEFKGTVATGGPTYNKQKSFESANVMYAIPNDVIQPDESQHHIYDHGDCCTSSEAMFSLESFACKDKIVGDLLCASPTAVDVQEVEACAGSGNILGRNDIGLDTMASKGIFCNPNLLTNIRKSDCPIVMAGVKKDGARVFSDQVGTSAWGEVYFSSQVGCNLLCFDDVQRKASSVAYYHDRNEFHIVMKPSGPTDIFRASPSRRLYLHINNKSGTQLACSATALDTEIDSWRYG